MQCEHCGATIDTGSPELLLKHLKQKVAQTSKANEQYRVTTEELRKDKAVSRIRLERYDIHLRRRKRTAEKWGKWAKWTEAQIQKEKNSQ